MKPPLDQSPLIGAGGAAQGWPPRGRLAPLASCEDLLANSPARGAVGAAESATEAVPLEDGVPLDDRSLVPDRCHAAFHFSPPDFPSYGLWCLI